MPLRRQGFVDAFHSWGRPRDEWLVGGEFERHLLHADGRPLSFFEDRGIHELLKAMAPGWSPVYEGDNLIALEAGGASVTLEPGCQFEFSGRPHRTLRAFDDEARAFNAETRRLLQGTDVEQVALGFTPFAKIADIAFVPKGRYAIMRDYLGETGSLAHHMMKGTCAVQVNLDYADEADCALKVQVGTRIGPLTTAMFANSPISEGKPNGFQTFRGHIWTKTDPARTGFPDSASSFSFEKWVDYLLDVPMMFTKQKGRWTPAHGKTFAQWMTEPEGPTEADWGLHMTSVFPEVRVKRTIEIRGADCVDLPLATAMAALFKGLLYDVQALSEASELSDRFWAAGTSAERFEVACRDGLGGQVGRRSLAAWAEDLVTIAHGGLQRLDASETRWLAPLEKQVQSGESPAAAVLRAFEADPRPGVFRDAVAMRA